MSRCSLPAFAQQASFAASHVRRQPAHGNNPCPSTLASDHVLAASKTSLDLAIERQRCLPSLDAAGGEAAAAAQAPARAATAWHLFLRDGQQRRKQTMRECAAEWRSMTQEQKQVAFEQLRSQGAQAQAPAPLSRPPAPAATAPWPHCGDDFYPIRAEKAQDLPCRVRELSAKWVDRVGDEPIKPCAPFEAPPCSSCEDLLGRGRCKSVEGEEAVAKLAYYQKRLDRWSAISKPASASFDQVWSTLPLFYVGEPTGPSGAEQPVPSGMAALLLFPRLKGQLLHLEKCKAPEQGDVISLHPSPALLKSNVEFAREWLEAPGSVALRITYKCVGLAQFQVLTVESMSDVEARHAQQRAQKREAARLANLIKGLDSAMRRGSSERQARRRAAPRAPAVPGGQAQEADDGSIRDEAPHFDWIDVDADALQAVRSIGPARHRR